MKDLLQKWRTRKWFSIELNPDNLEEDVWYSVNVVIKKDRKGNQIYDDFAVFSRKLSRKEFEKLETL